MIPVSDEVAPSRILDRRRAGVLLHLTSLPGGNLGKDAYRFVDFLVNTHFSVWQLLPLGPPVDDSPYQCLSVHAGDTRLLDRQRLIDDGWLDKTTKPASSLDIMQAAWNRFNTDAQASSQTAFESFRIQHHHWLEDYVLFVALREHYKNLPWWEWPKSIRARQSKALDQARREHSDLIDIHRFGQFLFFQQWLELKHYANSKGVLIFGDTPIYAAEDSVDVWVRPDYFKLDENGRPNVVAGVPPDNFSDVSQRWGNPLYDWQAMQTDGFQWWIKRLDTQFELFDLVRIDHFRGFQAYWEIPARSESAIDGYWVEAPGEALFETLKHAFTSLPLVAEDLGTITPEVIKLRDRFGFPGMKLLHYAFDDKPNNIYLPENHEENSVIYPGTHDNDTTLGWFNSLGDEDRSRVLDYLEDKRPEMPWALIDLTLSSIGRLAIIPMQDLLGLGSEARMNLPGTQGNHNWRWKFKFSQIRKKTVDRLRLAIKRHGR